MSPNPVLATTLGGDIQPLRVSGMPVVQSYRQIVDALQRTLSADHAALLAEPSIDRISGNIQWYSRVPGTARPLASLDPQSRSAAELRLAQLIHDIHRYADKLADSKNAADRLAAENLRSALEIPVETANIADRVFMVGDQPVLFGWGHVRRGPAAPLRLLRVMADRRLAEAKLAEEEARNPAEASAEPVVSPVVMPEESPPAPVRHDPDEDSSGIERTPSGLWRMYVTPRARRSLFAFYGVWWSAFGWLLFTLLMLLIGWLLLKYCALGLPGGIVIADRPILDYCSRGGDEEAITALRRRIDELDDQIRNKQRACTAARPPRPPGDSNTRVEREGGRIGAINVVLTWDTDDDLDLQVTCPGGQKINYSTKSGCGGKLDVDRNAGGSSMVSAPVENIVWEAGAAPRGKFTVQVTRYQTRSSGQRPTGFTVELKIDGRTVESRRSQAPGEKVERTEFEFELPRN